MAAWLASNVCMKCVRYVTLLLFQFFLPETDKELKPQNDFINRRIFNEFLILSRYTASG